MREPPSTRRSRSLSQLSPSSPPQLSALARQQACSHSPQTADIQHNLLFLPANQPNKQADKQKTQASLKEHDQIRDSLSFHKHSIHTGNSAAQKPADQQPHLPSSQAWPAHTPRMLTSQGHHAALRNPSSVFKRE